MDVSILEKLIWKKKEGKISSWNIGSCYCGNFQLTRPSKENQYSSYVWKTRQEANGVCTSWLAACEVYGLRALLCYMKEGRRHVAVAAKLFIIIGRLSACSMWRTMKKRGRRKSSSLSSPPVKKTILFFCVAVAWLFFCLLLYMLQCMPGCGFNMPNIMSCWLRKRAIHVQALLLSFSSYAVKKKH